MEFIINLFKREKVDINKIINNIILDKVSDMEINITHNEMDVSKLINIMQEHMKEVEKQNIQHKKQLKICLNIIKKQNDINQSYKKDINDLRKQNDILNEKLDLIQKFVLNKN